MRLIVALLIAVFAANGEEVSKSMVGTWKFDPSRSDWSHKPGGPPREVTLKIGEDNTEYVATDQSGKKTDLLFNRYSNSVSGNADISVRYEPTGNPGWSDMRVFMKATGKELERVVTAAVPGGNALVIYGSGVMPDGTQWWDTSYFIRSR